MAGLRMRELRALRWRDVDFAPRTTHVRENWTQGETTTPKGGTGRAVPMAEEIAERPARLGQRDRFTAADDLVFCTPRGQHLGYADSREVMEWMGHADLTTRRYLPQVLPPIS